MKRYIFAAMAMVSMLFAGCSSDKSECTDNEAKSDCNNGKYSLCVDGKWTEETCKDDVSCNAENKCGECKNDDIKKDCSDGKYSKCVNGKLESTECADNASCKQDGTCGECANNAVKDCENGEGNVGMATICQNGQWSESKVECQGASGKVSCTADKVCGECLSGDSTKCEEDAEKVGSAILCTDGKWTTESAKCPGLNSCAMTGNCYQCYLKCDKEHGCNGSDCENNNACKKECGDCDSKCGECITGSSKNCTETEGIGSADVCINGTWRADSCSEIRSGWSVSCFKTCPSDKVSCTEAEKESQCGFCKNTDTNSCICVSPNHPFYDPSSAIPEKTEFKCKNGNLAEFEICPQCIDNSNSCVCLL